jgi:uncharacterized membrane-anchored protein
MSTRFARLLIAAGLLAVLAAVNVTVARRETLLREGQSVFLELAPRDPRSLMQGDYMALEFAHARKIPPPPGAGPAAGHGYLVVRRDAHGVGQLVRVESVRSRLAPGELAIEYRLRGNRVRIVTNAWFFEEGQAKTFEPARFGELRVDSDGKALLVALRDKDLNVLGTR